MKQQREKKEQLATGRLAKQFKPKRAICKRRIISDAKTQSDGDKQNESN